MKHLMQKAVSPTRPTLLLALLALGLVGCAEKADVAQFQFDRGLAFYRNGDFDQAIAAYSEAIRRRPAFAEAYYERGLTHVQMGDLDAAIADYTDAIRLRPEYRQAYNNRGVAYAQREDYDKAIEDCTRAIELDPDDDLAYRNRGLAYHDTGQIDKAVEDCTSAIRLNPASAESYLNRGNAWLDQGGYKQAIADFTEAIHLNSDLSKAYFSRAIAHEKRGETGAAAEDFRRAKQLNAAFDIPREYLDLAPAEPLAADAPAIALPQSPSEGSIQAAIERRAIEIAREHYKSEGYETEEAAQPQPFELVCRKGQQTVYVEVKADAGDGQTVRLTREELEAAREAQFPVDLFVVGSIDVSPGDHGVTAAGGHVVHHLRGWKPDDADLDPLAFEYHPPR